MENKIEDDDNFDFGKVATDDDDDDDGDDDDDDGDDDNQAGQVQSGH